MTAPAPLAGLESGEETLVAGPFRLTLVWRSRLLAEARLDAAAPGDSPSQHSPAGCACQSALAALAAGSPTPWPDLPLDLTRISPFAQRVHETLLKFVPAGRTISYGQLALLAGRPGAARAVGSIMAKNPWPLLVPCHRVVGSTGALTGYSGGGVEVKRTLLQLESAL